MAIARGGVIKKRLLLSLLETADRRSGKGVRPHQNSSTVVAISLANGHWKIRWLFENYLTGDGQMQIGRSIINNDNFKFYFNFKSKFGHLEMCKRRDINVW